MGLLDNNLGDRQITLEGLAKLGFEQKQMRHLIDRRLLVGHFKGYMKNQVEILYQYFYNKTLVVQISPMNNRSITFEHNVENLEDIIFLCDYDRLVKKYEELTTLIINNPYEHIR